MNLYLNELAPWERKKEYYHHIKLGKDVNYQATNLKRAINNATKAQLSATNTLIASQEGIAYSISELNFEINAVEQGIEGLGAAFEWGISEVVWQIEQNRAILKDILEVLMAPLDTQAIERKKRAQEAFFNGWIDDAEEEFIESEKLNKYDFSIHISLGLIYLFHLIDKDKAISCFNKAIKYSRPKSDYHTSYALLHKALALRGMGKLSEAEKCAADAYELTPTMVEASYQNAVLNAILGKKVPCLKSLRLAIEADKRYCIKANSEIDFDSIRDDVNSLIEKLRNDIIKPAACFVIKIEDLVDDSTHILNKLPTHIKSDLSDLKIESVLIKLRQLISRNSYFDALVVREEANILYRKILDFYTKSMKSLKYEISNVGNDISSLPNIEKQKVKAKKDKFADSPMGCLIWLALFIGWGFIVMQFGISDHDFFVSVVAFSFLFGGKFIAKGILMIVAELIYHEKNVSLSISRNKDKEKMLKSILLTLAKTRKQLIHLRFQPDIKGILPNIL
jgi:tetratricopeptide (TPR) repeat protein